MISYSIQHHQIDTNERIANLIVMGIVKKKERKKYKEREPKEARFGPLRRTTTNSMYWSGL